MLDGLEHARATGKVAALPPLLRFVLQASASREVARRRRGAAAASENFRLASRIPSVIEEQKSLELAAAALERTPIAGSVRADEKDIERVAFDRRLRGDR